MYSDGRPIYGMPEDFRQIFAGKVQIIPTMVLWAALILIIAAIVLKKTKIGEYTLAIGGNEEAALVCGIRIKLYKIIVYSISGMLSAFASIMLTARLNAAEPIAGASFELDAIAAVVMGGTALTGGKATLAGTVIAALTLGVLRNGLTLLNLQSYFQQVVIGVVILLAVIIDKKRSEV
jgi:ribose transport system permease protein